VDDVTEVEMYTIYKSRKQDFDLGRV